MKKISFDLIRTDNRRAARKAGKGGFFYTWKPGEEGNFPHGVALLTFMVPYTDCDRREFVVAHECTIGDGEHALTGTLDKPTLSGVVFWRHVWKGTITDGFAKSQK